jgi:DNA-binding ferritin-like protein (Dps family)
MDKLYTVNYKPMKIGFSKYLEDKVNKIIKSLKKMIREKAEYKACRELLDSLPNDYRVVFKEIEKYMLSLAGDESILAVLMDTLESAAVAAQDGRSVFSITGEDVGTFCDNLIEKFQVKTWIKTWRDNHREKFNKNIHKKIGMKIE